MLQNRTCWWPYFPVVRSDRAHLCRAQDRILTRLEPVAYLGAEIQPPSASATPVTDALKRLVTEGLVEIIPPRHLRHWASPRLRLFDIRLLIEGAVEGSWPGRC
jgi:hypothetical protein